MAQGYFPVMSMGVVDVLTAIMTDGSFNSTFDTYINVVIANYDFFDDNIRYI